MKKEYIIILSFSAVLASCSTGNEITSNYFDDGIYFDPTYKIDPYAVEESQEYIDSSNVLPDYAYSESFDYYDPNMVSATQPNQSYTNFNGGGSNWGFSPSIYVGMSFGNSFYNPYGYPYYNPYDYGYGGFPGYGYPGYGYGYPGYGYPGYGYGYPGYGYPGYGYPGYCPPGGSGGTINTNLNGWIGNSITSDWSTNRFRTKVNGSKTGSRSATSAGTNVVGPKKTSGEIPKRALETQTSAVATSGNTGDRSREISNARGTSEVVSRQPIKQRQTVNTRSGKTVGASAKPNSSKVKRYYANSNTSNVVKNRTYTASQNTRSNTASYNRTSVNQAGKSTASRRNTSANVTRKTTKNYYNSGTNAKPKTNTRSNVSRSVKSFSPSRTSRTTKPSNSSNFRSSGSSMRSSSPSSSPSRSSGGTRASGGGRR